MIKELLEKLIDGIHLSLEESELLMNEIMNGNVNNSQLAGILIALKTKGETPEEIAGFAKTMREKSNKLFHNEDNVIDVCGTGGDNSGTFNISTAVAFAVAGAGIKVAKHGNKSISSKSGSADVLQELGININLPPEYSAQALSEIGLTFLFAPQYHPAMKYAAPVRNELGMKTIFNMLGPLTNPANVKKQIIGTFNNNTALLLAEAALYLDFERVCFLCTDDKFDEVLLKGKTLVVEYNSDQVKQFEITAESFGYGEVELKEILGGTPKENGTKILDILKNKETDGPFRTVIANAALALYTAEFSSDLLECTKAAEESIKNGNAYEMLIRLKEFGIKYN